MKTLIYLFRVYLKHLDNRVWWLLLFLLIIAIADGIGISMLMPLLQSLELDQGANNSGLLFSITNAIGVTGSLQGILTFMFMVYLTKALVKFSSGYYQSSLYKELYRKLKVNMYNQILKVDYQYFSSRNTGHFITVINDHVQRMITSFNMFILVVTSITMAISYMVLAGSISWQVSVVSVFLGGAIMGLMSFITKYIKRISKKISNQEKHNSQIAIQALYAFKYIVSTASFHNIKQLYKESIESITILQFKSQVANAFSKSLQELATITLLISLIIVEVVWLEQSITSVFVILLLFYRAVNQLLGAQINFQNLVNNIGMIESVDEEMDQLLLNQQVTEGIVIPANLNQNKIQLKGVFQKYKDGSNWILQDINFTIYKNQTVAFVGPSGVGKSTLVDLLTGLLIPQKGEILTNGVPLARIDLVDWRSRIGYVSQEVMIFDDTIWNNICLFDKSAKLERIQEAAEMSHMWNFSQELENGLQTRVGDRGMRLSGGQKQRLSIARELYKKPDLLILDEATSALDGESEGIIKEAIDNLKGKMTVVIIAHRLSTIKHADLIYVMDKGRIIESGTYEELTLQQDSKFQQMIELQNL